MNVVVCALFVATFAYSLVDNPDLLSPAKFYLVSFAVFNAGALAVNDGYQLWLLLLLVLLVGTMTVFFERMAAPVVPRPRPADSLFLQPDERRYAPLIWLLSAPAVLAQAYVIQKFGGINGYLNIIANRVQELRGLGALTSLSSTMMVMNLIYFALGLLRPRSRFWWALFLLHTCLLLAMGALMGSRGGILNVFALQLMVYHYLRRRVSVFRALPIAVALLAFAMILGVVREGLKFEDSGVTTGLQTHDSFLSFATFNYGVTPLAILVRADDLKLAHGSTLASLVTNVVPRDLWPDKPDSGGVFFTKTYTGNAWDGVSNLTPTLLGEFIINFGWVAGICLYSLVNPALMYFAVSLYRRVLVQLDVSRDASTAVRLVRYLCLVWSIVALMTGELTNVVVSLVVNQLLPIWVAEKLLIRRA